MMLASFAKRSSHRFVVRPMDRISDARIGLPKRLTTSGTTMPDNLFRPSQWHPAAQLIGAVATFAFVIDYLCLRDERKRLMRLVNEIIEQPSVLQQTKDKEPFRKEMVEMEKQLQDLRNQLDKAKREIERAEERKERMVETAKRETLEWVLRQGNAEELQRYKEKSRLCQELEHESGKKA